MEQFWLEEAELHEAEDNWAASYDARAEELSQGGDPDGAREDELEEAKLRIANVRKYLAAH